MNHLTKAQLDKLKNMLKTEIAELERHNEINEELDDPGYGGELSFYDNHPADLGTDLSDRVRNRAVDDALDDRLLEAREALQRMDDGTYGICAVSGEPIPFERLEALPSARTRIEFAHEPDNGRTDRPPEEDVMTRPPSGAGENRQRHAGRFDDADAWKIAESYGTSSEQGEQRDV